MNTSDYRPQIGETIFVSLVNGQPFLVTVNGYRNDKRFSSEQFEYTVKNGRDDFASLCNATFYPGVPIETAFVYVVVLDEHEFMEKSDVVELGYFFDPKSAFDYIEAILCGNIKPIHAASAEFASHSVRVEKV